MGAGKERKGSGVSSAFKTGAIALAFLVVGYESALFVQKAAQDRVVANTDHPDTVYVVKQPVIARDDACTRNPDTSIMIVRKGSTRAARAIEMSESHARRRVENFPFDPNSASQQDFMRLGFSEKQARSILNYRASGGRFRRKGDFAKSFVVADSVYKRLEPYITIPKLDINKADSAAFDTLPGIGGYFARKMVEYRKLLGGYSCPEQLMEIYHFGQERYDGLKDLIICTPAKAYPFWTASEDSLRAHPHIRSRQTARAIIVYRRNNPPVLWTLKDMKKAGVLTEDQFIKLSRCNFEAP